MNTEKDTPHRQLMFSKCLAATLSTLFVALTPGIALSEPLQEVPASESGNLVCYIQTEDGQTVDLMRLCGGFPSSNSAAGSGGGIQMQGYTTSSGSYIGYQARRSRTSKSTVSASKSSSSTSSSTRRKPNRWTYLPVDSGVVIGGYAGGGSSESLGDSSGGGTVYVKPYFRKDGTQVDGHTRRAPRRGG